MTQASDIAPETCAYRCDVLIAGMGPVGATLAALLGRRGISVIVIEPEQGVYPLPRAAHIDHEIMRIFQVIGIVDAIAPFVRAAPDYEFRSPDGAALMRVERDGVIGASGWSVGYNVYQPGVETALRAALAAMPTVRTIVGARFSAIVENDAAGVVASIDVDGNPACCVARFLVGCDGAWSPVREACGLRLDDYAFDEPWLVLDALVPDESGFPPMNLQLCDPLRPTSFVHMGPGRLRWEFMLKPGEDAEAMKADAAIAGLLAPWQHYGDWTIERRAVYRFHGLVADQWRRDSIFIAGDAAHQMPPFMGQGMCSGLRDAANLAWKLEAALQGQASPALLDSYRDERDPHVRYVVEKAIEMGRVVCTLDPAKAAARDGEMLAQPRIGPPAPFPPFADGCILPGTFGAGAIFPQPVDTVTGTYLDDHLGDGAWLIHRCGVTPPAAPIALRPCDIGTLPPALAHPVLLWLDHAAVEAVLVRPDRYVYGTGTVNALIDAYSAWFDGAGSGTTTQPRQESRVAVPS